MVLMQAVRTNQTSWNDKDNVCICHLMTFVFQIKRDDKSKPMLEGALTALWCWSRVWRERSAGRSSPSFSATSNSQRWYYEDGELNHLLIKDQIFCQNWGWSRSGQLTYLAWILFEDIPPSHHIILPSFLRCYIRRPTARESWNVSVQWLILGCLHFLPVRVGRSYKFSPLLEISQRLTLVVLCRYKYFHFD